MGWTNGYSFRLEHLLVASAHTKQCANLKSAVLYLSVLHSMPTHVLGRRRADNSNFTGCVLASSIRSVTLGLTTGPHFFCESHRSFGEAKKKIESGGRVDSRAYTIFIGRDDTWFQDGSQKKKKSLAYGDVSALTRRPSISFPVCLRAEPLFFFLFCNILWIGWLNITAAAGSHRKCARASSHVVPLRRIG